MAARKGPQRGWHLASALAKRACASTLRLCAALLGAALGLFLTQMSSCRRCTFPPGSSDLGAGLSQSSPYRPLSHSFLASPTSALCLATLPLPWYPLGCLLQLPWLLKKAPLLTSPALPLCRPPHVSNRWWLPPSCPGNRPIRHLPPAITCHSMPDACPKHFSILRSQPLRHVGSNPHSELRGPAVPFFWVRRWKFKGVKKFAGVHTASN